MVAVKSGKKVAEKMQIDFLEQKLRTKMIEVNEHLDRLTGAPDTSKKQSNTMQYVVSSEDKLEMAQRYLKLARRDWAMEASVVHGNPWESKTETALYTIEDMRKMLKKDKGNMLHKENRQTLNKWPPFLMVTFLEWGAMSAELKEKFDFNLPKKLKELSLSIEK